MKILRKIKSIIRSFGYDIVKHIELSKLLELHKIDIVFDIGANDGRYAKEVRESGWSGQIVSFEPQPLVFERLTQNMAADGNWRGMQMGLGSREATLKMNSYQMDVMSSFLDKIEGDINSKKIDVIVKRPDSIFEIITQGRRRPFVKVDTQGYELEIIEGFGGVMDQIVGWQIELSIKPLYDGQPSMEKVIAVMRSKGFSLWRLLPGLSDPINLRSYEMDGIFFRE
jgi:FkbM family methyltransferase